MIATSLKFISFLTNIQLIFCTGQTYQFGFRTIYISDVGKMHFDEGQSVCSEANMQLAEPYFQELNDFLKLKRRPKEAFWIGMNYMKKDNTTNMVWKSNEMSVEFTDWCPNSPQFSSDQLVGLLSIHQCWKTSTPSGWSISTICEKFNPVEPNDILIFRGKYYYFYSTLVNFFEARTLCNLNNQDLLVIDDEALDKFITEEVKRRHLNHWMDLKNYISSPTSPDFWNWNNKSISYTNWCSIDVIEGTSNDFSKSWCGYKHKDLNCWRMENCQNSRIGFICRGLDQINAVKSNDVQMYKGKSYVFYSNAVNFFEARGFCNMNNQELLVIEDEDLDNFIRKEVKKRNSNYWMNLKNFLLTSMTSSFWNWDSKSETLKYINWCPIDIAKDNTRDFSKPYCGYYNKDLKCWRMENCLQHRIGFICQTSGPNVVKKSFDGVDYFFYEHYKLRQPDAKRMCQDNGQVIASIDDSRVNEFVKLEVLQRQTDFWIGLERYGDLVSGLFWHWASTGYDSSLFMWCNTDTQQVGTVACAYMTKDGCWMSANCQQIHVTGFICEESTTKKAATSTEVRFFGKTLHFYTSAKVNYFQAYRNCIRNNQELVTIDDQQLDEMISNEAKKRDDNFWLGSKNFFECPSEEKFWHWNSTNSPLTYRNWCPNDMYRTDDSSKNWCVYLNTQSSCWKVSSCESLQIAYICEDTNIVNRYNPYCQEEEPTTTTSTTTTTTTTATTEKITTTPTVTEKLKRQVTTDMVRYLGINYFFYSSDYLNFYDAYTTCELHNQVLLSLENQVVSKFIAKQVQKRVHNYWIGLKNFFQRSNHPTFWHWNSTQIGLTYTNWCPEEVSNGKIRDFKDHRCGYHSEESSCWKIKDCDYVGFGVICQEDKILELDYSVATFDGAEYNFYQNIHLSQSDAKKTCQDNGQELVTIDDQEVFDFIRMEMWKRNKKLWIGLEAETSYKKDDLYMYWRWVNTGADVALTKWCPDNFQPSKTLVCGYVTKEGCWEFSNCQKNHAVSGFICENKLQHTKEYDIIMYKGFEYFIFKGDRPISWYDAREKCRNNNKQLVSLEKKEKMNFFNRLLWNENSDFWIGAESYTKRIKGQNDVYWRWSGSRKDITFESWCGEDVQEEFMCGYISTAETCWQKMYCNQVSQVYNFICEDENSLLVEQ